MPRIAPFVGLVFDRSRVGSLEAVTTPPYDTIGHDERRAYVDASPYNVIRLDLAEDEPDEDKYRSAAETLRSWREGGALVATPRPAYFAYEMRFPLGGRRRRIRGLVCQVELEPWGGSILPHERTMAGSLEDRMRLLRAVRANLSCVYGVFPGPSHGLAGLLDEVGSDEAGFMLTDEEGVEHRMWVVDRAPEAPRWLADQSLLIADGHHRYTTALRFRDEMHAARGAGPWDHVMMLLVDAAEEQPPVLPYHRLIAEGTLPEGGTPAASLDDVIARLSDDEVVCGVVYRDDGGLVRRIVPLPGSPPAVRALHREVLDGRVPEDAITFTQHATRAEAAVAAGEARAAVLLPPTTTERIREVVERGERLPQKSTFFWPKPRTGMVFRLLDE